MLLPPGFRFHPTKEELIMYYLKRKVMGKKFHVEAISELNIYKFYPSDLPDKSCLRSKDLEWYFFCPRERKYASGSRMNRATENGYWKTTGKDRQVLYNGRLVGMEKTLIFHLGHAPDGQRTNWVIHEYRNVDEQLAEAGVAQDAYVLCKIFQKNGPGPNNGAQYGAPFNEEEWDDDELDCYETFPSGGASAAAPAALHLPENPSSSVLTNNATETTSIWPLAEPGPSSIGPSADAVLPNVPDDDILHYLESFTEDGALPSDQIDSNEKIDTNNHERDVGAISCLDGNEVYNGLGDLGSWQMLGDTGFSLPTSQEAGYMPSPMFYPDSFLELNDLEIPLNCSAEDNERVHMPASNNPYGDSEQLYFGSNHFDADLYYPSLSQLPLQPDGSNNIEALSGVHQVSGDGSNANPGSGAAHSLAFTQPNGSQRIDPNVRWIL